MANHALSTAGQGRIDKVSLTRCRHTGMLRRESLNGNFDLMTAGSPELT